MHVFRQGGRLDAAVLYTIKRIKLITICSYEKSGREYICLMHSLLEYSAKKGDALLLLIFNVVLAYVMRKA